MFDELYEHLQKFIAVPTVLSILNFLLDLLNSLSDGVLTDEEIHALIKASSGIEIIFLFIVVIVVRMKSKKPPKG